MKTIIIFFSGLLIMLNSSSVFAFYEIKAVQLPHTGPESNVNDSVQVYAAFLIANTSKAEGYDRHVVKVSGIMTDSNGNASFKTKFVKVVFTSNVSFELSNSDSAEFIDAQITQKLQKELALFSAEIWNGFVDSNITGYEVISANVANATRIVRPLTCFCGKVTVTVLTTTAQGDDGIEEELP
jgi:hypothetical protein